MSTNILATIGIFSMNGNIYIYIQLQICTYIHVCVHMGTLIWKYVYKYACIHL